MNAKALAQEASSWYLSHLNPYSPHGSNVESFLRVPVLGLTLQILASSTAASTAESGGLELEQHEEEAPQQGDNSSNNDSWRSHLTGKASGPWTVEDQEAFDELGRRTRSRMDAFIAGCSLAVPDDTGGPSSNLAAVAEYKQKDSSDISITKDGLAGFSSAAAQGKSGSPMLASLGVPTGKTRYPQFRGAELSLRLELYVRTLMRVASTSQECVVALEPQRNVKARAGTLVRSFVATVGCVQSMGPTLTNLVESLTRELLAVDTLCDEISKVIGRLVSEYEHQTSFASLAFLSSPEDSAENRLTPLVVSYIKYLQSNWERLLHLCGLEIMLSSVLNPEMRQLFKTIEFVSIGHLLEVCRGFEQELLSIQLPPTVGGINGVVIDTEDDDSLCSSHKAVKQAIRDLQREVLTVNGHVLPPVNSRRELVHLLSQTLNSRSLFSNGGIGKRKSKKSTNVRRSSGCPPVIASSTNPPEQLDSEGFLSSGNEGDTDGDSPKKLPPTMSLEERSRRRNRRRSTFHLSTVDVMTRRLLVASCRTGMGGDAYFIVQDLFGGDDVEVVPSRPQTAYGRARAGTIEILVRLASVTIKCHGCFDVYPKSMVGDVEPLIQLHTTTTETINLHEVRAIDSEHGKGKVDNADDSSEESGDRSQMVLQEKKTDRTGWRTLSIRPALYEKVEEWNTPS